MTRLIFLAIFISSLTACSSTKGSQKNMIEVTTTNLEGSYKISIHDQIYFDAREHGSVGQDYELTVGSDHLKLVSDKFEYDDKRKSKMSGGDGGTRRYVFEAVKSGETFLVVKDVFRGDVQQVDTIWVMVE